MKLRIVKIKKLWIQPKSLSLLAWAGGCSQHVYLAIANPIHSMWDILSNQGKFDNSNLNKKHLPLKFLNLTYETKMLNPLQVTIVFKW